MLFERIEKLNLQLFAEESEATEDIEDVPDDIISDEPSEDNTETEETEATEESEEEATEESETEENSEETAESEEDEQTEQPQPYMSFASAEEHRKYISDLLRPEKEKLEEYEDLLDIFAKHFEVNDITGLKKKADEFLDDIAFTRGTTKDKLKEQKQAERELRRFQEEQREQRRATFENAIARDCQALKSLDPDIYGDVEPAVLMKNQQFISLLKMGLPFKQAYDALNIEKITQKKVITAKKKAVDNIKAKPARIKENATVKKSGTGVMKIDPAKLSDEEIEDIERRVAAGERIIF